MKITPITPRCEGQLAVTVNIDQKRAQKELYRTQRTEFSQKWRGAPAASHHEESIDAKNARRAPQSAAGKHETASSDGMHEDTTARHDYAICVIRIW